MEILTVAINSHLPEYVKNLNYFLFIKIIRVQQNLIMNIQQYYFL